MHAIKMMLWIGMGLSWTALSAISAETRTWTSVTGEQAEAKFISLDEENVILEQADGAKLVINQSQLSVEDRAYVQRTLLDSKPNDPGATYRLNLVTGQTTSEGEPLLPHFTEGPWMGAFAVYEAPHYTFVVNADRTTHLYLKDGGQVTGTPLRVLSAGFYQRIDNRNQATEIASYNSVQPALNRRQVTYSGNLKAGPEFSVTYEFAPDRITVKSERRGRPDTGPPVGVGVGVRIPAFFSSDQPEEEKLRLTEGWVVELGFRTQRNKTILFTRAITDRTANEITIRGPWGARELSADTRRGRGRDFFALYYYQGMPIYRGFGFGRDGEGNENRIQVEQSLNIQ